MAFVTWRRAFLWVALNVAAAAVMPAIMWMWITRLSSRGDASLPEGFTPSTLVLAFTFAWLTFLLLLNVAMGLFVWLRGRD